MNPKQFSENDPKYLMPLRAYWGRYIEIGLSSLIVNAFMLATPVFAMLVYDKIIGNNITQTLWALAIGMLLFAALDFVLRAIRAYYVEQIAIRSDVSLDEMLVSRLMVGDIGKTPPVGSALAAYRELTSAREFISAQTLMVLADLPFTVVFMVVLGIIGGPIVLSPLLIGTAVVVIQTALAIPTQDYLKTSRQAEAIKLGQLTELISAAEVFASTKMGTGFRLRWKGLSEQQCVSQGKSRFWNSLGAAVTMSSSTVTYVTTMVIGVFLIESQSITVGALVAASMLSSRALANISQAVTLFAKFRHLKEANASLNRIISLHADTQAREVPPAPVEGRLFVRALSHRFRKEGLAALENANFGVESGERIGIVGRPGSGKSTLVRALAGVIHPSNGDVLVDGIPVNRYLPEERSEWLVYKPQEPLLFAGTLEDNVRAGNRQASAEAVMQALAGAGLREAIRIGELSLAHEIAPYGSNLSGGQRQAIALARALLSTARIVILDEPTSGFDIPTEQAVAQYLHTWSQGKTLILATHSPLLLNLLCDRLIVVNGGKVVADGPRQKILQNG
jgi:ATP-binding cassette subfamily B protein/ATP-binding cassette subfamily C protein LapB